MLMELKVVSGRCAGIKKIEFFYVGYVYCPELVGLLHPKRMKMCSSIIEKMKYGRRFMILDFFRIPHKNP